MVYFAQCLFHGPFFVAQSRPTDSSMSVIGHIHLIWTHQGRFCSGSAVHQEKWCLFTEAAMCCGHKRTMAAARTNKNKKIDLKGRDVNST